jgi:hypothetical protein
MERCSIVCIQETKNQDFNDFDVIQLLGSDFDYTFLPSVQTRCGILVAWNSSICSILTNSSRLYSTSIKVKPKEAREEWCLTWVYDPANDVENLLFLAELHDLRQVRTGLWLLVGDFNMIYKAEDKSNDQLNGRQMG